MLVICTLTACVQEQTKMVIVKQRIPTDTGASMQKTVSSVHMQAGSMQACSYSSSHSVADEYSFESTSASSMSTMMAESMTSMSSSSQMMEMSAHSHAEASSRLRSITKGFKKGEIKLTNSLNLPVTSS